MENNEAQIPKEVIEQHPAVQATEKAVSQRVTSILPGEKKLSAYGAWMDAFMRTSQAREQTTDVKLSKWGEFRASLYARWRAIAAGTKDIVYGAVTLPFKAGWAAYKYLALPIMEKIPGGGIVARFIGRPLEVLGSQSIINYRKVEAQHAEAYALSQEAKYASIRGGRKIVEVGKDAAKAVGEAYKGFVTWEVKTGKNVVEGIANRIIGKQAS